MDIAQLAITTAVAFIGFYLVHSFGRQQRLRIAEQRVDAYRKLWAQMLVARPTRLDTSENKSPLRRAEAAALYGEMTNWYFEAGNGMMLPDDTKEMYLEAKRRLGEYAVGIDEAVDAGEGRMRELSLLRSQMKSDLAIYGVFYFDSLDVRDKAFLRASGIRPWRWGGPGTRRSAASAGLEDRRPVGPMLRATCT